VPRDALFLFPVCSSYLNSSDRVLLIHLQTGFRFHLRNANAFLPCPTKSICSFLPCSTKSHERTCAPPVTVTTFHYTLSAVYPAISFYVLYPPPGRANLEGRVHVRPQTICSIV
jgi:hypothetical protein